LLTLVNIFVESKYMDDIVDALLQIQGVEAFYEVTGEFDLAIMVSTKGTEELRDFLKNMVMKINGVKSTVSSIVLRTCKGPKSIER